MNFIKDTPFVKCLVRAEYLHDFKEEYKGQYYECYIFAVTSIQSRPLLFTCHTEHGAVYSRLPITAFCSKPCEHQSIEFLDPWGAISHNINVIKHSYLKDYTIENVKDKRQGMYLFTIDSAIDGWSEDPEQHKTYNVGFYEDGQMFALPNNLCKFVDKHFIVDKGINYMRQSNYWTNE